MHISGMFEKQDIDCQKQDIETRKQDIGTELSTHQQKQFEKIAAAFGKKKVFGRSDVVKVLI